MKVSIIVASMNRVAMLENCLRLIRETTSAHDIELICVIDEDIASTNVVKDYHGKLKFNHIRVGALEAFNQGLKLSTGDIIFPIGDDGYCHPGWLDYALAAHQNILDGFGMVALNDLMLNGDTQLGTTVLYDREFCKQKLGGVCTYPVYNYYYVDNELNGRAKLAGKYYWCQESIVEHMHSSNGKRPLDAIDISRSDFMELDRVLFEERKAAGFPNNFTAVI